MEKIPIQMRGTGDPLKESFALQSWEELRVIISANFSILTTVAYEDFVAIMPPTSSLLILV